MEPLVSTAWLADALGAPDLRILDATAFALDPSRNPRAEHAAGHIPGARFLDMKALADPDSPLPGMLPTAAHFAAQVGALGVGDGDRILIYDDSPHRTAARAWWMFRTFGARDVAILDGGLAAWRAERRPIEQGEPPAPAAAVFTAAKDETAVRDLAPDRGEHRERRGTAARRARERAVHRRGGRSARCRARPHPGSRNLPYGRMLAPDGRFKDAAALRAEFAAAGVDLARPLVTSCGSGMTAAVLAFGVHLLGKTDIALYDGSWSEYGADPATAKALGPA